MRLGLKAALTVNNEFQESVARVVEAIKAPHHFIDQFLRHIGVDISVFRRFILDAQRNFEASLRSSLNNPVTPCAIEPITHRIWLTSLTDPTLPPDDYLGAYFRATQSLPDNVTHYFWTNSTVVRDNLIAKAQALGCHRIAVMDINLFNGDPVFETVQLLITARKFVLAADMIKILVLYRFGGIYSDLGIIYDNVMYDLIRLSDYALIVTDTAFFQTSFIACAARSDLISSFLAVLNRPHAFDRAFALMGDAAGALDEVHIFAGLGFTACALLFLSSNARILVVPPQSNHMTWRSMQSWYGTSGKNGNALIEESKATILNADHFKSADILAAQTIKQFGNAKWLCERLRILVVAQDFFMREPTKFCEVFYYHGTDKAQAWHNYGYIYNFILGRLAGVTNNLLEVGMSFVDLDATSQASAIRLPGSSLRAWKELMPYAKLIGTSDDPTYLLRDERIETYYVDQAMPETVSALANSMAGRKIQIVIDDGLHRFEICRNLLETMFPLVAADGLYVVEDVPVSDIAEWEAYLIQRQYDGAILRLPHPTNMHDNCLIIIQAKRQAS